MGCIQVQVGLGGQARAVMTRLGQVVLDSSRAGQLNNVVVPMLEMRD